MAAAGAYRQNMLAVSKVGAVQARCVATRCALPWDGGAQTIVRLHVKPGPGDSASWGWAQAASQTSTRRFVCNS